jgi:16S rRNA (cytosine967-C5)-methyltransferase
MEKTKQKKHLPPRELAYLILLCFAKDKPRLDNLVSEMFAKYDLELQERKYLKNLTSGVVRHLLYLDWIAALVFRGKYRKLYNKGKTILRLALYEIIFVKSVPDYAAINEYVNLTKKRLGLSQSKMINGVLRGYLRREDEIKPEKIIDDKVELICIKYSFPLWLIKRWIGFYGQQETEKLCRSLNQPPEFELRIQENKISTAKFKELLTEKDIAFKESKRFDNLVTVFNVQPIINNGWFDNGYCSLQDESANIPAELLDVKDGDVFLDVCSAPGGKFTQILEKKVNNLLAAAVDTDLQRLKKVKENVERLGLNNGYYVQADGRDLPFKPVFTKILCDVPCSGLGVIRKHPDIKWRRAMDEIVQFSKLQYNILSRAARKLKPGGRLVYSACTIDYLECENVVESFLEQRKAKFEIIAPQKKFRDFAKGDYIQTLPHIHQTDGSFCAVFQKKI